MIIKKKILKKYFDKILSGDKTYEVRLADFKCSIGDEIKLCEWDENSKKYTGREIIKKITYVLKTKDINFWSNEKIDKYGFQIIGLDTNSLLSLQKQVKDFSKEQDLDSSVETRFIDLTSELGELGKEILTTTNYGKEPRKKTDNIILELGDVLFSLLELSNKLNIDISEALKKALDKYKKRALSGSIGSKNKN